MSKRAWIRVHWGRLWGRLWGSQKQGASSSPPSNAGPETRVVEGHDSPLSKNSPESGPSVATEADPPRRTSDPDPWDRAYTLAKEHPTLTPSERKLLDSRSANDTVLSVLHDAMKAAEDRNSNMWRYTKPGTGEAVVVREKFDRIVKGLDRYSKIVDVAIGGQPTIVSICWGTMRSLLFVYLNHVENLQGVVAALETILVTMARCEFYEKIYRESLRTTLSSSDTHTTAALANSLAEALPEFYCSVLVFVVKAKRYLESSSNLAKVANALRTFSDYLKPLIDEVAEKEALVKEGANMATMEKIKAQSKVLLDLEDLMTRFNAQFSSVTDDIKAMRSQFDHIRDEEAQHWLNAERPEALYDINLQHRLDGTCDWILLKEDYQNWERGAGARNLWVMGIPGAGKTVLSASLISDLTRRKGSSIVVLYFFFRNGDVKTTEPVEMVASLISQLIRTTVTDPDRTRLLRIIKEVVHREASFEDRGRNLKNLWRAFGDMLQGYSSEVIVLLDALDECNNPPKISEYVLQKEVNARFLVTGRQHVSECFHGKHNVATIKMETMEDIKKFIIEKVAQLPKLNPHADEIIQTVNENAAGMFRYAALVLAELNQPSRKNLSERLKMMPKGIIGMYELILRRLGPRKDAEEIQLFGPKDENEDEKESLHIRKRVLTWVAMGRRPMRVCEMQYACATVDGATFDPSTVSLPSKEDILNACGSLVEIFDGDKLRFTHLTVKEFLLLAPTAFSLQDQRVADVLIDTGTAHASIAFTCVTQLCSQCLFNIRTARQAVELSPLAYAIDNCFEHAREATPVSKDLEKAFGLFFWGLNVFDGSYKTLHTSAAFTEWRKKYRIIGNYHIAIGREGTPLHVAAFYGLVGILEYACTYPQGLDFTALNDVAGGFSPLVLAFLAPPRQVKPVVELLLSEPTVASGINSVEGPSKSTPLAFALQYGREDIAQLILGKDGVEVNHVDQKGYSALDYAVEVGSHETVELLKAKGAISGSKIRSQH
ncbi:hypothetical protein FN846DRAFT_954798 [Sphaerosporella brunnea]|uniref:NACHT domain-containing protein n=1 Tax=Sphaerosporella brunnea TaxID=1250544 RepID=A0A5J5ETL7_9PEZI|nr:hypothetical protein FN846DRAFT_954798 [Sphaerosporella brunnea]